MSHLLLAVEDPLAEALGRRLIQDAGLQLYQVVGRQGIGWLSKNAPRLNKAAAHVPTLMLVDQDTHKRCPVELIGKLLGAVTRDPNLLLRVCTLEAEAWVLADGNGFAKLVGLRAERVPLEVETIADPKAMLIRLAQAGRNRVARTNLVPSKGSTAKVGPSYNPTLTEFVANSWDLDAACERARSLDRARAAIRQLAASM